MMKFQKLLRAPLLLAVWACSSTETVTRDTMRTLMLSSTNRTGRPETHSSFEEASMMLHALGVPEVRTVFYHRLRHGNLADQLMRLLLRPIYPEQVGVELRCEDIGPGFVLGHGQSSVIWAKRIGEDCTIYQHVTVGLRADDLETLVVIGDRAWIWGGAMVIGRNIGDDATVGAASLVVREDVPAGRTAVGVPAHLI